MAVVAWFSNPPSAVLIRHPPSYSNSNATAREEVCVEQQLLRGAGGNRTPVRQVVAGCDTTIPRFLRYGNRSPGCAGTRPAIGLSLRSAFFHAVSGLSLLSSLASVARLRWIGPASLNGPQFCCFHLLMKSGSESNGRFIALCLCAPIRESGQLWSHRSASVLGVETSQPREIGSASVLDALVKDLVHSQSQLWASPSDWSADSAGVGLVTKPTPERARHPIGWWRDTPMGFWPTYSLCV